MSQQSPERRPTSGTAPRKRRRRPRKMNPLLYILLVVAVSAILSGIGWIWAGDVLALNKAAHSATVTLSDNIFSPKEIKVEQTGDDGKKTTTTKTIQVADVDHVADLLKENGLIEYKPLFKFFCTLTGVGRKEKLVAGTYELNTNMDYNALLNAMSTRSGSRSQTTVTIPEGYTLDQIFALLEQEGVATVETLRSVAANYDFKYSFLQGVLPLGDHHRLEGYLFPDTYEFYMGGGEKEAVQVLNKMILRFDQQFPDKLREQCADMGYPIHEMVTIASLIEKETDGSEQTSIASVIYNRLKNPEYETAGYLQIDATIAYVTGETVTQADYQNVDSPYNTYLNKGLPPGPIANPGMVSLNSALNPQPTRYYYYVLGNDGRHHFFTNSRDFEAFKATQRNG